MFSDAALGLRPIEPDDMSYKEYLDRPYGPAASAGLITILNLINVNSLERLSIYLLISF